jgi:hypothetical protein
MVMNGVQFLHNTTFLFLFLSTYTSRPIEAEKRRAGRDYPRLTYIAQFRAQNRNRRRNFSCDMIR